MNQTTDQTCAQNDDQSSNQQQADEIRQNVRESYAQVAQASNEGESCGTTGSCCGVSDDTAINTLVSTRLGYSENDLENVPEGADMGLGCGNPRAIASIQKGETILDLGSGGGFDCFLAAAETGDNGLVIGIDMTPTMISKARNNAVKGKYNHIEFRLGEIEHMPVANDEIDVIISNCVINLSPDKNQVFSEAFRVLKPGGRLAISDVVASTELPEDMKKDLALYAGCMAGASLISDLQNILEQCGFKKINIAPKDDSKDFIKDWAPGRGVEDYVLSATIEAVKPGGCSSSSCC
ncbi:Arsenite methyltransferase [hydrothermal vent metagenome]|uniref:Arsenite methyltransferase n=1 Tax=hydrothermal vent metagenome TaxID=652676 RepID=A0A3B0WEL1_9ZZZZ